jgi:hypothetical protein
MLTWRDRLDVGVLDYQLCHACRIGCVNKISIAPELQRKGHHRPVARGQGVLRRDGPPDRRVVPGAGGELRAHPRGPVTAPQQAADQRYVMFSPYSG